MFLRDAEIRTGIESTCVLTSTEVGLFVVTDTEALVVPLPAVLTIVRVTPQAVKRQRRTATATAEITIDATFLLEERL